MSNETIYFDEQGLQVTSSTIKTIDCTIAIEDLLAARAKMNWRTCFTPAPRIRMEAAETMLRLLFWLGTGLCLGMLVTPGALLAYGLLMTYVYDSLDLSGLLLDHFFQLLMFDRNLLVSLLTYSDLWIIIGFFILLTTIGNAALASIPLLVVFDTSSIACKLKLSITPNGQSGSWVFGPSWSQVASVLQQEAFVRKVRRNLLPRTLKLSAITRDGEATLAQSEDEAFLLRLSRAIRNASKAKREEIAKKSTPSYRRVIIVTVGLSLLSILLCIILGFWILLPLTNWLTDWRQSPPLTMQILTWIAFLILGLSGLALAIGIFAKGMIPPKSDWPRRFALAAACTIPITSLLVFETQVRTRIWQFGIARISERFQPVIGAIGRYQQAMGKSPKALTDLTPNYLKAIPETGIRHYPALEFEAFGHSRKMIWAYELVNMVQYGSLQERGYIDEIEGLDGVFLLIQFGGNGLATSATTKNLPSRTSRKASLDLNAWKARRHRLHMVSDLTERRALVGKSMEDVRQLIGDPDRRLRFPDIPWELRIKIGENLIFPNQMVYWPSQKYDARHLRLPCYEVIDGWAVGMTGFCP